MSRTDKLPLKSLPKPVQKSLNISKQNVKKVRNGTRKTIDINSTEWEKERVLSMNELMNLDVSRSCKTKKEIEKEKREAMEKEKYLDKLPALYHTKPELIGVLRQRGFSEMFSSPNDMRKMLQKRKKRSKSDFNSKFSQLLKVISVSKKIEKEKALLLKHPHPNMVKNKEALLSDIENMVENTIKEREGKEMIKKKNDKKVTMDYYFFDVDDKSAQKMKLSKEERRKRNSIRERVNKSLLSPIIKLKDCEKKKFGFFLHNEKNQKKPKLFLLSNSFKQNQKKNLIY